MNVVVGTDVVAVSRLEHAVRTVGDPFLASVFTPAERETCAGDWERLAARWAAKEATLKALGAGVDEIPPLDVEVATQPSGAPEIRLTSAARAASARAGWVSWSVSISHDAGVALAVVVALAA